MKLQWSKFTQKRDLDEEDETSLKEWTLKDFFEKQAHYIEDDFNLWVLETDFKILTIHVEALEEIPGVESLDIWSPYRLRIGIGRLFKEEEVKESIEYILNPESSLKSLDEQTKKKVKDFQESCKDNKWWAILILPNGRISTFVAKSEQEHKEKLAMFEETKNSVKCQLITS